MTRRGLLLVTLGFVLLAGIVLTQTRFFRAPAASRSGWLRADLPSDLRAHDRFTSEAALRYRRCQPSHWRAYVLQR
jgi:hypothetical protein